ALKRPMTYSSPMIPTPSNLATSNPAVSEQNLFSPSDAFPMSLEVLNSSSAPNNSVPDPKPMSDWTHPLPSFDFEWGPPAFQSPSLNHSSPRTNANSSPNANLASSQLQLSSSSLSISDLNAPVSMDLDSSGNNSE